MNTSGYTDVFMPAMCRLSGSYENYFHELQKLNKKFLQQYPRYPEM